MADPVSELMRRLRESAYEVMKFPHPSACDHLHDAAQVMREAADALALTLAPSVARCCHRWPHAGPCTLNDGRVETGTAYARQLAGQAGEAPSGSVEELRLRLCQEAPGLNQTACKMSGLHCGYWIAHYKMENVRLQAEVLQHAKRIHNQREEINRLAATHPASAQALQLVQRQTEDDGLWFVAERATEAYLQQALRELHAAVEGGAPSGAGKEQA